VHDGLRDTHALLVTLGQRTDQFPPDIRKDTDLLVITRTWFFGQGDRIWTE
jgi:hypothetical protein